LIAEETANQYIRVRFLNNKARVARLLGNPVEAQQLYQEAYELAKGMARKKDTALAQIGLGFALLDQEKFEEASACLRTALQEAWERRIMPEVIWAVVGLAALTGQEGHPKIAARWLRSAIAHPSCPYRVRVEAMTIGKQLALADIAHTITGEPVHDPNTALEVVVAEILR
jgi:tetratricopeptide (TPR) repeat protein